MKYNISLIILLGLVSASFLFAQVPQLINYQGMLNDKDGQPINTQVTIKFSIYGSKTTTESLWNEDHTITPVNGLFNVLLGSVTNFPTNIFRDHDELYLALKIGKDEELTTRFRLGSVAFALSALPTGTAGGDLTGTYPSPTIRNNAVGADEIATGAVGASEIASNAVGSDEIATGAVGASEIASNAVGADEIQTGAVGSSEIASNAVGADEIATGAVGSSEVADGSLTHVDIQNEPGIVRNETVSWVNIPVSGTTTLLSASITIPSSGYIVIRGYAIGAVSGTTLGNILLGITNSSTETPIGTNATTFGSQTENLSASTVRWGSMTTERTFNLSSSGTYTYYLRAYRGQASSGSVSVGYPKLLLTFFSTNYGTVTINSASIPEMDIENNIHPGID